MTKYYIYHCSISEIDTEDNQVNSVLEAHSDDSKIYTDRQEAIKELRTILDKRCVPSLTDENERLMRVVAALDRKLCNAATVPV